MCNKLLYQYPRLDVTKRKKALANQDIFKVSSTYIGIRKIFFRSFCPMEKIYYGKILFT